MVGAGAFSLRHVPCSFEMSSGSPAHIRTYVVRTGVFEWVGVQVKCSILQLREEDVHYPGLCSHCKPVCVVRVGGAD